MSPVQIVDQPLPLPNNGPAIQDLVIDDIRERRRIGEARYGTALQAHNGRDPLVDAYQEALDLCMYLRQEIEERDSDRTSRAIGRAWMLIRGVDWADQHNQWQEAARWWRDHYVVPAGTDLHMRPAEQGRAS